MTVRRPCNPRDEVLHLENAYYPHWKESPTFPMLPASSVVLERCPYTKKVADSILGQGTDLSCGVDT